MQEDTREYPAANFCMGIVNVSEIVAAGKDWSICRQGRFTRFDATGNIGDKAAPRSIPYCKEMANSAIDTLRDKFVWERDDRGLEAVKAMQAYVNEAF